MTDETQSEAPVKDTPPEPLKAPVEARKTTKANEKPKALPKSKKPSQAVIDAAVKAVGDALSGSIERDEATAKLQALLDRL